VSDTLPSPKDLEDALAREQRAILNVTQAADLLELALTIVRAALPVAGALATMGGVPLASTAAGIAQQAIEMALTRR
jgi:hypothetical protein